MYFNMTLRHGTGKKGARAAVKKILPEAYGLARGEGGDFFTSRRSEPLQLSIPHARNFVLCLID